MHSGTDREATIRMDVGGWFGGAAATIVVSSVYPTGPWRYAVAVRSNFGNRCLCRSLCDVGGSSGPSSEAIAKGFFPVEGNAVMRPGQ